MNAVFADTFFFLAAINPADGAHERAIEFSDNYNGPLLTTAWVITEVADALAGRNDRHLFHELYESITNDPRVEIFSPDAELFRRALDLYFDRRDKDWSLTDCTSFVLMTDRKLSEAATGDHHFEQAGFRPVLR
jgi:predicted nucleic acid-binding protein